MTCLSTNRPFIAASELNELKYDLWEKGQELECFHASPDKQFVRNHVFGVIGKHLSTLRADAIVVDKPKVYQPLQDDRGRFYKKILDILLSYVLNGHSWRGAQDVVIVLAKIDSVPHRKELERGVRSSLQSTATKLKCKYKIQHAYSKSEINLQIVDYICWAISRKWERGDTRSYDLIKAGIKSEFNVFE